jgi:hypothetical protein
VSHHPVDEDKQKEMLELTAAGPIPPLVQGQTDGDFHQVEL